MYFVFVLVNYFQPTISHTTAFKRPVYRHVKSSNMQIAQPQESSKTLGRVFTLFSREFPLFSREFTLSFFTYFFTMPVAFGVCHLYMLPHRVVGSNGLHPSGIERDFDPRRYTTTSPMLASSHRSSYAISEKILENGWDRSTWGRAMQDRNGKIGWWSQLETILATSYRWKVLFAFWSIEEGKQPSNKTSKLRSVDP